MCFLKLAGCRWRSIGHALTQCFKRVTKNWKLHHIGCQVSRKKCYIKNLCNLRKLLHHAFKLRNEWYYIHNCCNEIDVLYIPQSNYYCTTYSFVPLPYCYLIPAMYCKNYVKNISWDVFLTQSRKLKLICPLATFVTDDFWGIFYSVFFEKKPVSEEK